jgi:hypothetical protein
MIVTGNVGEFRRIARDRIPIREVPVVEIQVSLTTAPPKPDSRGPSTPSPTLR